MPDKCKWEFMGIAAYSDEPYFSPECIDEFSEKSCGKEFTYCPYCGKPIEEVENYG